MDGDKYLYNLLINMDKCQMVKSYEKFTIFINIPCDINLMTINDLN